MKRKSLRQARARLIGLLAVAAIAPIGTAFAVSTTIVAGSGVPGYAGDGGPAALAELNRPEGIFPGQGGSYYIADSGNHRVRILSDSDLIGFFAGDGGIDYKPTVFATAATIALADPIGVTRSPGGTFWIADAGGQRVWEIGPGGRILALLGTGDEAAADSSSLPGSTSLLYPVSLLPDGAGVLVSEMGSGRILRVDAAGSVSVAAQELAAPWGLTRDVDGSLLVADYGGGAVFRVQDGVLDLVTALPTLAVDGDPDLSRPALPSSVAVGRDGSLYIASPDTGTVFRLTGDGDLEPFLTAPDVTRPVGLCTTPDSHLLIADEGSNRIVSAVLPFPPPVPGDVDGDGKVDIKDAVAALEVVVGASPFNRRAFLAADLYPPSGTGGIAGDGRVTVQDVILLLHRVVGD